MWNNKKLKITKATTGEIKTGGMTIPDFKSYYNATVVKTVWYLHKNRPRDQWKIEGPEITPHIHSQLIFNQGIKQW